MAGDIFNVHMLKPSSKVNNQFHYIPHRDPHYDFKRDRRLLLSDSAKLGLTHTPADSSSIPYDSWSFVDCTNPKITLLTSKGYNRSKIVRDRLNSSLSWLQDAQDWRNIEATHYIYVEDVIDSTAFICIKARTGLHQTIAGNCEGFCYQANVRVSDCATSFSKEQYHGMHIDGPWNTSTTSSISRGPLTGKWTGIKFVIYNSDMKNNLNPTLEIWIDWSANNDWKLYDSLIDSIGSAIMGSGGAKCGGDSGQQAGTWGGPAIHFEWNHIDNFKFKWLSCREIDPFGVFSGEGSAAGGGVIKLPDLVPVPSIPLPSRDQFRIKMMYSSKTDGEYWFMPSTDVNTDIRLGGETPKLVLSGRNSDGSWKIKNNPSIRYGILTSQGFDETKITSLTPSALASAGYMMTNKDFRNVEITGYFRVNTYATAATIPAAIRFMCRGGKSSSSGTVGGKPAGCEATQYWLECFLTGKTQFRKSMEYPSGITATNTHKDNAFSFQKGKWIGLKGLVYNSGSDVYMALYVDERTTDISRPANVWVKSIEYTDTGTWDSGIAAACGGTGLERITWGGPVVTFAADNITDIDVALLSVREIDTTLDVPLEQNFLGDLGGLGDFSGWIALGSDWGLT